MLSNKNGLSVKSCTTANLFWDSNSKTDKSEDLSVESGFNIFISVDVNVSVVTLERANRV